MNAATIKDVAAAAGVSVATVSRVLSNPDVVKPKTRERVLQIIDEMNYKPNGLARQLRAQSTNAVVVIVPTIKNVFLQDVITGIGKEAEQNGYQMLIADLGSQPSLETYYIRAIQEKSVDGIISLSANMTQRLQKLITDRYPLVMATQPVPGVSLPSISVDNKAASMAMMSHLFRLGHSQIAYITSDPNQAPYLERMEGFLEALKTRGIDPDPGLISCGEQTIQGGYEQMRRLLAGQKKFTAVFAAGDTMAIGAVRALQRQGLRVPSDIAVVGFDDIEMAAFCDPALTTIRQPKELIGRLAFQKLTALMHSEKIRAQQEYVPYELIIRESCGYLK